MVKPRSATRETPVDAAIPSACRKLLQIRPNVRAQYKRKKSWLLQSVLEYLTSDSFMYGPLLTPPPSPMTPATLKPRENCGNNGQSASQIEEHAGCSSLSTLHSPPSTPISRLRTMSTLTRRFLGRSASPGNEENTHVNTAPASVEVPHKYREDSFLLPSLKHKEKLSEKDEANGNGVLTGKGEDADEDANADDEDEESSKSYTESQSESDVMPLHKDPAMELVRRLVRKVGGRLSKELGIFVDVRDCEVERWFLATTFLSYPLEFELSKKMSKKLQSMGISKIVDVLGIDQSELEEAFQDVMHNHREMRSVWPGANPDFGMRTRNAAKHLHLLSSSKDGPDATSNLVEMGQDAGLDVRDLELALLKLSYQHARHYRNCPGGRECEFARITLSDVDQLIANL
ncbi:hypothetical protein GOP47_0029476 [Adiantum capillus-veneris]|nr:hypothetical protein GOP47_0029476 [Adiantum capillus-veneris]